MIKIFGFRSVKSMGSEVSQSAHLGQSAGLKDFHFVGWLTDLDATIKTRCRASNGEILSCLLLGNLFFDLFGFLRQLRLESPLSPRSNKFECFLSLGSALFTQLS